MNNLENDNYLYQIVAERAVYKEQELEDYANNPFLEAMPPIFSEDDVLEHFMYTPIISDSDRSSPENLRYHVLKRVKSFIQPLPIHFLVERRLSTLIRRGYLARNPLNINFLERLRVLAEMRDEKDQGHLYMKDRLTYIGSTADSLSIIGISGIGKTTAIERLLQMYPQVIKHEFYRDIPLNRTQIVWLKIDCPYDGNLSTLCKSFFEEIDRILGTRYLDKFGYLTRVTSSMLLHMTSLASLYGIGVLVIDEIQHLLNSKNDQEEMLNFFVTLSNTVGIPTVLIGTSKAQQLFKGNFRQARRAGSDGSIVWDRMSEESAEWEFFIETLWELQCLKSRTELTDEIKKTIYYECQGITAIAVNLFILTQERVLFDENNPNEVITPLDIRTTAKVDMKIIQPMIKAIRTNNVRDMIRYEDIMVNLDDLMLQHKQGIEYEGKVRNALKERINTVEYKQKDISERIAVELAAAGLFSSLKSSEIQIIVKKIVERNPIDTNYDLLKMECLEELSKCCKEMQHKVKVKVPLLPLLNIYEQALKKKEHPYEVLKAKYYIKDPLVEFFHQVGS
ncbi:ATP-binding protein [Paenibacillus sp. NAIST15-1]|uniref:ATP-binding protein n=1 Tax=Paenibacillus sp. NAIST15-1 TaxID=1605994 RepID=UPI0009356009|nr:ATP-binding protein [Paenibacillus sp. NAIST15-1]